MRVLHESFFGFQKELLTPLFVIEILFASQNIVASTILRLLQPRLIPNSSFCHVGNDLHRSRSNIQPTELDASLFFPKSKKV